MFHYIAVALLMLLIQYIASMFFYIASMFQHLSDMFQLVNRMLLTSHFQHIVIMLFTFLKVTCKFQQIVNTVINVSNTLLACFSIFVLLQLVYQTGTSMFKFNNTVVFQHDSTSYVFYVMLVTFQNFESMFYYVDGIN